MQQENRTARTFSERTDKLAVALGCTLSQLASHIGVSRGMLSTYRTGNYPISDRVWMRLERAEIEQLRKHSDIIPSAVAEAPAPFSRSPVVARADCNATPAPLPTSADCLNYLRAYLADAEQIPGAVAHAWVQLQLHLPLAELEQLRQTSPPKITPP